MLSARILVLLLVFVSGLSLHAQDQSVQRPYSLQKAVNYLAVDPFGFKPRLGNQGLLIVYTDTEEYNDGQILYYPHTAYKILDQTGKFLRKVPNRITRDDETPTAVQLPAGFYLLETPWKKTVVELKAGCITTARLYSGN